jgi:hypothetical protein
MFSLKRYRSKAAEYVELGRKTDAPKDLDELKAMERSFTTLADNEDWLAHNSKSMVRAEDQEGTYGDLLARKAEPVTDELAGEEEQVLRCLGAAVIMQWNTLPKKLQRELFDNASSMGELLETKALRGNIARFLHKHKGNEPKQTIP